jgi:hypothetical protein
MTRTLMAAALAALVLYAGDYLSLTFGVPPRPPISSVEIRRLYAVKLRNKETSYMPEETAVEKCVNSLFPQSGYAPCWWVNQHKEQRIDIDAGRPGPLINTP